MTYATRPRSPARRGDRYKEMEVLSATPGALVVLVYDHLLTSLLRARAAIVAGDAGSRVEEIGRARDAVGELLATLDLERGGAVAGQLGGLYTFFLRELTFVSGEATVGRIDRVVAMVRDLRDAFEGIQRGVVR